MPKPKLKYDFAETFDREISGFGAIAVIPEVESSTAAIVRDTATSEFYLAVVPGERVALRMVNYSAQTAALPMRIGGSGCWTNVFRQCDVTDPDKMPASGMWELGAGESFVVDTWRDGTPLVFTPSDLSTDGTDKPSFPAVEIYWRVPVNPDSVPGTNAEYKKHAIPVARFYVVSRAIMAAELRRANGFQLDPTNYVDWTPTMLRERYPSLVSVAATD